MVVLLIALLVTVVGKFHAQEPVASLLINTQAVTIPLNRKPAGIREISRELQPLFLPATTQNTPSITISEFNSPQRPFRLDEEDHETLPNTRIFDMSSHSSEKPNPDGVRDHLNGKVFDEENSIHPKEPDVPKSTNQNKGTTVNINGTEVTFNDRSAFTGDQCPTGYVRINGKCVEEE